MSLHIHEAKGVYFTDVISWGKRREEKRSSKPPINKVSVQPRPDVFSKGTSLASARGKWNSRKVGGRALIADLSLSPRPKVPEDLKVKIQ